MMPLVSTDVATAMAMDPQVEVLATIETAAVPNEEEDMDLMVNDDTASLGDMAEMQAEEDEHFFMHSTHQKSSAKLLLLDLWGVLNDKEFGCCCASINGDNFFILFLHVVCCCCHAFLWSNFYGHFHKTCVEIPKLLQMSDPT